MPQRRKRLTEKLNELDQHIEEGAPLDSEVDEPLQQAIGELRQAADASPDKEPDHEALGETLGDLAMSLEVSHPRITEMLNHLSEILAGVGI